MFNAFNHAQLPNGNAAAGANFRPGVERGVAAVDADGDEDVILTGEAESGVRPFPSA
jgi:hypothetical protein